jgi:hypothetical protein
MSIIEDASYLSGEALGRLSRSRLLGRNKKVTRRKCRGKGCRFQIILIEGYLMIDFNVAVTTGASYDIKEVDF